MRQMAWQTCLPPLLGLLLCFVFIFQSCSLVEDAQDIKAPVWEPDVAVPLVSSRITIQDVLDRVNDDTLLTIGQEGQLSIAHEEEVMEVSGEDVVSFPDFSFPVIFNDIKVPLPPIGDANLNQMRLKQGTFFYEFSMPVGGEIEFAFSVENFSINNEVMGETRIVNTPGLQSFIIDLNGYLFDLSSDSLALSYEATYTATGLPALLTDLEFTFRGLNYSYADGFLGRYEVEMEAQEIETDFFKGWDLEGIKFDNPMISFFIHNSFGVPVGAEVKQMDVQTKNGLEPLVSSELDGVLLFAYPNLSEVGEMKTTEIGLNGSNSNLSELIEYSPEGIIFDMEAYTDPAGDNAVMGFVTDSSKVKIDVRIELPISGSISGVTVSDTVEVDMASNDLDQIRTAQVKLITENDIPAGGTVQAIMLDVNGAVLDSLFEAPTTVIEASQVDANGKTSAPGLNTMMIDFSDESKFEKLKNTHQIVFRATFSTSNNGTTPIKIFSEYEMSFKMGIIAGLKF